MINPRCCGQIMQATQGRHCNMSRVVTSLVSRLYSKDKGGKCCENISQTQGRKVEPWPKADPPPQAWRAECPQDTLPPNYDPYRIKVPEVMVPPLPPSNAKWSGVVLVSENPQQQPGQPGYYQQQGGSGCQQGQRCQPYQWEQQQEKEQTEDKTFMGLLKGFFGRMRGKGKESSERMMLDTRRL